MSFAQKPLTLTLEENQLIRNAAKKFNKQVFFVGTQQRSDRDRFLRAVNMVHKGLLGDIKKITVGINGGDGGGPIHEDQAAERTRLGLVAWPGAEGRLHPAALPL